MTRDLNSSIAASVAPPTPIPATAARRCPRRRWRRAAESTSAVPKARVPSRWEKRASSSRRGPECACIARRIRVSVTWAPLMTGWRGRLEGVAELQEDLVALGAVGRVEPEEHGVPRLEPEAEPVAAPQAAQAESGVVPRLPRVVERGQLVPGSDFEAILRREAEQLVPPEAEARIAAHREAAAQGLLEVEGHVTTPRREALGGQQPRGEHVPRGAEGLVAPGVEDHAVEGEVALVAVRVPGEGQAHEVPRVG